jgi:hypothetical protein
LKILSEDLMWYGSMSVTSFNCSLFFVLGH